jgi:Mrp family chromosome partitioning ATPase
MPQGVGRRLDLARPASPAGPTSLSVTTPQPLAREVAVRAALMAQKDEHGLLGGIEKMSWLIGTS